MARPKSETTVNQTDYKRQFNEKTYDRLSLYVKKGGKERYRQAAAAAGCSLNEFAAKAMDRLAAEILGE